MNDSYILSRFLQAYWERRQTSQMKRFAEISNSWNYFVWNFNLDVWLGSERISILLTTCAGKVKYTNITLQQMYCVKSEQFRLAFTWSKLTKVTLEQDYWTYFANCSIVYIVNFEHVIVAWVNFHFNCSIVIYLHQFTKYHHLSQFD